MAEAEIRRFVLENKFIRRELVFEQGKGLRTCSLLNKHTGREYVKDKIACEFFVGINGDTLFGYKEPVLQVINGEMRRSGYSLEFVAAERKGNILRIRLHVPEVTAAITVCYLLDDDSAGITKWLEITAEAKTLCLGMCFFEVINAYPGELPEIEFFTRHGLERANHMFVTQGFDDIMQAHNPYLEEGLFIANDAPGPLKRFLVYPNWFDTAISVGYNCDTVPFGKYLEPSQTFISHKSCLMLYAGRQDEAGVRNALRAYLRKQIPEYIRDEFMYCTWIPFLKNINETLLLELADKAAALGVTTFVVDDGWFADGNWKVDEQKFPRGLEPVAERIRALGMRFGLWFNIGTEYGNRGRDAEDNALDARGEFKNSGFVKGTSIKCMASKHCDLMIAKLAALAERYSVGYFKLDFSNIISPYGVIPTGCHCARHAYHRNAFDSVFEQYACLKKMRDGLKEKFPGLIVDFSFEAFGTDWPNLAALQYSELHHSSNLNTHDEKICTARDIRNVLYRFCTLLPVERIMGSLICLQGDNFLENLFTAFIGSPLLAGDLRELDGENTEKVQGVFCRVKKLTAGGPLTEFVKLRGDLYIKKHDWDGFARFNCEGTGLVCLFRNESDETPILQLELPRKGKIEFSDLLSGKTVLATTAEALRNGVKLNWHAEHRYLALKF